MRHSIATLLVIVFALCGCKTQVALTVKNVSDGVPMGIEVRVLDRNGMNVRSVSLGDVAPGSEATTTFEVKNGSVLRVTGDVQTNVVVYRSSDYFVGGKEDPFVRTIEAKPVGRILDDSLGFQKLSNSFKNLGEDVGAQPIPLKDALVTRIGALIVATPGSADVPGKQFYTVSPGTLGVKVMSRDDIEFPLTDETEETVISGSVGAKVNASYGPVARFGFEWSQDTVYELKWVMRGYGQLNKIEEPEKSPAVQFNLLPDAEMEQIKGNLAAHPDSRIYYINKFYVLRLAEMFVKEGKAITAGGEADASSVITANAVYTFKESKEKHAGYSEVVLNYEGMELVPIQVAKDSIAPDATRTFGPAWNKIRRTHIDVLVPTGRSSVFRAVPSRDN